MKEFNDFLEQGIVKKVTSNYSLIKSIYNDALKRIEFYKKLKLSEESYKFILENIYDSLRELADAILIKDGYKSYSHEASIIYLKKYGFSMAEINDFDRLRILRNNSKYYGKNVDLEDVKFSFELVEKLLNKIKNILNK